MSIEIIDDVLNAKIKLERITSVRKIGVDLDMDRRFENIENSIKKVISDNYFGDNVKQDLKDINDSLDNYLKMYGISLGTSKPRYSGKILELKK